MQNSRSTTDFSQYESVEVDKTRSLLSAAFGWMFLALGVTTLFSLVFAFNPSLMLPMLNVEGEKVIGLSILGWVVMFAPLGFVFAMSLGWQRFSFPILLVLFILYSAINGISFSFIFMTYSIGTIFKVFASTSALFGFMAIVGATTKTDLTKMGSFLMMALFGIIIASVINFFTKSSGLDYIISFVGVLVFTGLTAYDVQKIKNYNAENAGEGRMKLGLMGALSLYLDFINLFLMLLRLFGRRN